MTAKPAAKPASTLPQRSPAAALADAERLLRATLEALTLPPTASSDDNDGYLELLCARVGVALVTLESVLDSGWGLRHPDAGAQIKGILDHHRRQLAELTPALRYTPGPPIYGIYLCVACGEHARTRRDHCDHCAAPGVDVVRLDRDQYSTEHHPPLAHQWPAPAGGWRTDPDARREGAVVRTAAGLDWHLDYLPPAPAVPSGGSWHLTVAGWQLAPLLPASRRRDRSSLVDARGRTTVLVALDSRTRPILPAHAQVMVDRLIARYTARQAEQAAATPEQAPEQAPEGGPEAGEQDG